MSKNRLEVSKGMLSLKDESSENSFIKKFVEEFAPSPRQLVNEHEGMKNLHQVAEV